jgi:hypothetical protein
LGKDMGSDSIEIVLIWEEAFGISISDAEAETMFTSRQAIDRIFEKVRSNRPEDRGCLSMRAFFRLRKALEAVGVPRRAVRPDAKLAGLLPNRQRRDILSAVTERVGFGPLKPLPFGLQFTFGRVRDIVLDAVIRHHAALRLPGYGWSRAQVREVVRAVLSVRNLGTIKFSDDDEFVEDLRID